MALLGSNYATTHTYGRLDTLRSSMRTRYDAWKVFRATRRELENLSDRELVDLGLRRSDIAKVARAAAYGI